MTLGFLFWLFMILSLVFGGWRGWSSGSPTDRIYVGGLGLAWVLFLLLGIQVFGWPIKG